MKKIYRVFINALSMLLLIIPVCFEHLAKTKMGVHRYVVAKNIKFERIFTTRQMTIIKVFLIISVVIACISFITTKVRVIKREALIIFTMTFISLGLVYEFISFKVYYFFLISIILNLILRYLSLGIYISEQSK